MVVILHIYGDRQLFDCFFYHQETESESCEIKMCISQPLLTHKQISKALWEKNIHTIKYGWKTLW